MTQTPGGPGVPGHDPSKPPSKIHHTTSHLGPTATTPPLDESPLPVAETSAPPGLTPKIRAFERERRHEDEWSRTPNTTGTGAIHVRTFHSKLTDDALKYMDDLINEWLDAHPQYEVKFVTSSVGVLTGKTKEPHLICQVWV